MPSFRQDLRFAVRALARRPAFSLMAAITLALGIGATTAIFSVVNSVLLRPLPYPNAERIVAIWQRATDRPRTVALGYASTPNFEDWREGSDAFEATAQFRTTHITFASDDGAELIPGGQVTPEYFRVFGAEPVMGRTFSAEEARFRGPSVAIVSHGFWRERLGSDPNVLGSTLRIQGGTYEVIGVAPDGFDAPGGARIWIPVQNDPEGCGRGCILFAGIGLLRPGVTVETARAQVEAVSQRLAVEFPGTNTDLTGDVATLREVTVGNVRPALFIVLGAVVMVLLIACANVANLLLVRGAARHTEMAVRAVLGAGRGRLLAQLVTESAVLGAAGALLGIVLASWGVDMLRDVAAVNLPRASEIGLDARALGFGILLSVLTVALFGLAPALQLSSSPFAQTLREGGRGATGGRNRGRAAGLAIQVALSVTLLLGAGLLLRSLVEMRSVDPGFDAENVAHFSISLPSARFPDPAQRVRLVEEVRDRLARLPGVENAGFILGLPLGPTGVGGGVIRTDRPAPPDNQDTGAAYRAIDPTYLETMRIPVLQGRGFLPTDRAGSLPVALISRALAERDFPGEDPIGKQVDVQVSVGYPDTLPRTIVGVVEDVHTVSLTTAPQPALYTPEAQAGAGFGAFVIRSTQGGEQILRAAREVVQAVDDQVPLVRPGTMAELIAADTASTSFYLMLIGLFAVLAVTLAAVGMYGVVAFVVAQRTREIGVRMALGARAQEVVSLVVWQGLRPALIGAAIGIAGALATGRLISGLLYGVAPQDPLTLLAVSAILLAVVALACMVPARRATLIPPATALRAD